MVKTDNFYTVFKWMKDVGLKGLDKEIFAIIYGFSQGKAGIFHGSLSYLGDITGASKDACCRSLAKLTENGFIEKKKFLVKGVLFCTYAAKVDECSNRQKVDGGIDKKSMGVSIKSRWGIDKKSINNIYNNKNNNIDNNIGSETPFPDSVKYETDGIKKESMPIVLQEKNTLWANVRNESQESPTNSDKPSKKPKTSDKIKKDFETLVTQFNKGVQRAGGIPINRKDGSAGMSKDAKNAVAIIDAAISEGWAEKGGESEFLEELGFRHYNRLKDFRENLAVSIETARRTLEKSWLDTGVKKSSKIPDGAKFDDDYLQDEIDRYNRQIAGG